jgi:FMN phosphatase YigB (HAD superfamily)
MPRVIVCDVNETLLDVGALEPHFKQTFGDGRVLQEWFANVLLYSEVVTLSGPYSDFASIGGASLDMVASARGITLPATDWDIVGALRAGCAAAFVARPGKVLYPLGPKPDITGPDFRSVATQIVAAESRQA